MKTSIMKILSWNIFINHINYQLRIDGICKELININADIVCLQEVTFNTYKILMKNLKNLYYFSEYDHNDIYTCVILIKNILVKYIKCTYNYKLEGIENRKMIYIDLSNDIKDDNDNDDGIFRISTAHLEKNYCIKQSKIIVDKLNEKKFWVWMGDTNMNSDQEFQKCYRISDINPTYYSHRFAEHFTKYPSMQCYDRCYSSNNIRNKTIHHKLPYLSDHDPIEIEVPFTIKY